MSFGWQWRFLHSVASNFIFTTKCSFHLEFGNCIMRHIMKWNSFLWRDAIVTKTNTNFNMHVILCNYLIELNFRCSCFLTTLNSFFDDQRRCKHDRKRKLHYKMSPWSCQNNFGCIIVLANNPTATYFCWHSTKCERYLPQFALKYSHRHKDLIG